MTVTLHTKFLDGAVRAHEWAMIQPAVTAAHETLCGRSGPGAGFLGWLDLPTNYDKEEFARIKQAAARIRADSDVLIVVGIGGSYLGARAAIEFLRSPLYNEKDHLKIYFAGNTVSPAALADVLDLCKAKRVSVNVISKSGTTTEPAVAFRALRRFMEETYGADEAKKRIYATTDKARGTLKALAGREGYETFVVPDDVGGRYSVLTAVGLLPIAAAGADVDALMAGAARARRELAEPDIEKNPAYKYAAARHILMNKGRHVEMMVAYEPLWGTMAEWFKQLFGESEGKDGKGLLPASVVFSTDLHSMGQFIQDGSKLLFETVMQFAAPGRDLVIENDPDNIDGLNFLSGRKLSEVNRRAFEGTALAHADGGTPSIVLEVPDVSEDTLGYLFYFFEKACAVSGYMLGVNPFDQPGVESYKRNMFALLGKPGYEEEKAALEKRL
ncbi:MAG: glucose-6-phosphate isomerase [Oscillospiraceae bacterium]|nr:glucose-6-phosphate isomerase [Oscillospiraceae bacterium]